jgi:hypothetical protein
MRALMLMIFCVIMSQFIFSQPIFCIKKINNTYQLYDNHGLLAITTEPLDTILAKTDGTINPPAIIQGTEVYIPGSGFQQLPTLQPDHITSSDDVICTKGDTAWVWNKTSSAWDVQLFGIAPAEVLLFDEIHSLSEFYILMYVNRPGVGSQLQCMNMEDSTDFIEVNSDSIVDAFFIRGITHTETTDSIYIGKLTVAIATDFSEVQFCAKSWCYQVRNTLPATTFNYLYEPQILGIDSGPAYALYQASVIARANASGNFVTALDALAQTGNSQFVKTNYFFSLNESGNAPVLKDGEQRLLLSRLQYPGFGVNTPFDLGFVRYQNGRIISGDQNSGAFGNNLNIYDSLGQYIESFRMANAHCGEVVDSFTVNINNTDSGAYYITPPFITNNKTGISYTPSSSELYPLIGDSCIMANGLGQGAIDIDHGNSISMTWIPALGKYLVLKSSRNVALYPISWPLCAWEFDPVNGFSLDMQLIHLLNTSSFGINRDGGHDFEFETELSNPDAGYFKISQFDNVVCDDPSSGPSYGHTADLVLKNNVWEIQDSRIFAGPPSTSMGGVDMFINHSGDTSMVLSSGRGFSGFGDVYNNPQIVVYNHSTQKRSAQINFSTNQGASVTAYQCNATSDKFPIPQFHFSYVEETDSVRIIADSIPETGVWFWWLGNKPLNQSIAIPKLLWYQNDGLTLYASGRYSAADTVPGIPENSLPSRWIGEPVWIHNMPVGVSAFAHTKHLVALYPNPTNGQVMIDGVSPNAVVIVHDLSGRQIMQTRGRQFNLSDVPPGAYLIRITDSSYQTVKKLIKL